MSDPSRRNPGSQKLRHRNSGPSASSNITGIGRSPWASGQRSTMSGGWLGQRIEVWVNEGGAELDR